jgi:hypothetical protein
MGSLEVGATLLVLASASRITKEVSICRRLLLPQPPLFSSHAVVAAELARMGAPVMSV